MINQTELLAQVYQLILNFDKEDADGELGDHSRRLGKERARIVRSNTIIPDNNGQGEYRPFLLLSDGVSEAHLSDAPKEGGNG